MAERNVPRVSSGQAVSPGAPTLAGSGSRGSVVIRIDAGLAVVGVKQVQKA
jgi:hypothetical protein